MVHPKVGQRHTLRTMPSYSCWPKRGTRMWHEVLRKTVTLRRHLLSNLMGYLLLLSSPHKLITGRCPLPALSTRMRLDTMSQKAVISLFPSNLSNTLLRLNSADRSNNLQRTPKTFHAGNAYPSLISSTCLTYCRVLAMTSYFPNCRYGVSCHYAHPALPAEPGYYAIPPPQPYLPYDPNAPIPYNPQFYPGHPGFPPPHQIISQPPPPAPASPQLDATSPAQSPESIGQFPPPPHPPSGYAMTPYASANGVPAAYIAPFPAGAPGAYPTFPYPPPSPTQQRSGEQLPIPIYTYPPFAVTTAGPTATSTATPSSAPTTETEFRKNGREAAADGSPRPAMNGAGRHARDTPFSRRPSRLSVNYSGPRKTQALCMFFPSGKCRNG